MKSLIRTFALILFLISLMGCASIAPPTVSANADNSTVVGAPVSDIELAIVPVAPSVEILTIAETPVVTTVALPEERKVALRYTERDMECMATSIYYEAKSEGLAGQSAVGYVVLNRIAHKEFPNSVCGVIYQKRVVRSKTRCEFSWACGSSKGSRNSAQYQAALTVARGVLEGRLPNPIGNSLFFHARRGGLSFAGFASYVVDIGNHRFYSAR